MRRETVGVGGHLEMDFWSHWQAVCVCVVETEKGNVADRCRKDGGIRWGKRDSSHLRALLKEARKKCEEYSGKGI